MNRVNCVRDRTRKNSTVRLVKSRLYRSALRNLCTLDTEIERTGMEEVERTELATLGAEFGYPLGGKNQPIAVVRWPPTINFKE